MPTVRIWTVESDYDRDAVKCLANKLATYLHLDNLSVQVAGRSALPEATQFPLDEGNSDITFDQDACVIFVIDTR